MAILEVKNLKKNFGKTDVLKGINFSVEKGEVLALIGSSGSGKTTLMRCLNFLERPDKGTICSRPLRAARSSTTAKTSPARASTPPNTALTSAWSSSPSISSLSIRL